MSEYESHLGSPPIVLADLLPLLDRYAVRPSDVRLCGQGLDRKGIPCVRTMTEASAVSLLSDAHDRGFLVLYHASGEKAQALLNTWFDLCRKWDWPYIYLTVMPHVYPKVCRKMVLHWDWITVQYASAESDVFREWGSFFRGLIREQLEVPTDLPLHAIYPKRHGSFVDGGAYTGSAYGAERWRMPVMYGMELIQDLLSHFGKIAYIPPPWIRDEGERKPMVTDLTTRYPEHNPPFNLRQFPTLSRYRSGGFHLNLVACQSLGSPDYIRVALSGDGRGLSVYTGTRQNGVVLRKNGKGADFTDPSVWHFLAEKLHLPQERNVYWSLTDQKGSFTANAREFEARPVHQGKPSVYVNVAPVVEQRQESPASVKQQSATPISPDTQQPDPAQIVSEPSAAEIAEARRQILQPLHNWRDLFEHPQPFMWETDMRENICVAVEWMYFEFKAYRAMVAAKDAHEKILADEAMENQREAERKWEEKRKAAVN